MNFWISVLSICWGQHRSIRTMLTSVTSIGLRTTRFNVRTHKEKPKMNSNTRWTHLFCSSNLATSSSKDFVRDFERGGGFKLSWLLPSSESPLKLLAIVKTAAVYLATSSVNWSGCHELELQTVKVTGDTLLDSGWKFSRSHFQNILDHSLSYRFIYKSWLDEILEKY